MRLPNCPDICKVEPRSIKDYGECYNEYLADDRNGGNLNDNGKYHCSIVGPMIFPLRDLSQVVPATLHIMLGIVLLLYNLLVDDCKKLYGLEGEEQVRKIDQVIRSGNLHHSN